LAAFVIWSNRINRYQIFSQLQHTACHNFNSTERLESQIIEGFGSNKTKSPKQGNTNRLRSAMSEGGEP
jgi:hypothetical protein